MNESTLDKNTTWYFGNNRRKNLKLKPPKWYAPFFLTSSYEYAQDYADYGVYTITLKGEINSRILDFNKPSDAKKLKWPKVVVDKIREGKNDLNSIAYDLYILAFDTNGSLMYIDRSIEWMKAAEYFKQKSKNIFINVELGSSVWGSEKDHQFLLQMWKDIYDAGFDGFTHTEFGSKVLSIFNFHCIEKISINPINAPLNEKKKQRELKKLFKAKGANAFPKISSDDDIVFVSDIPKDKALQLLKRACHDVSNFHPEYMNKAIKWSDDRIFGLFNKHDKRNVLALASIEYNNDPDGAAYLHEMTGFMKGGYGKKLVLKLMEEFKKIYGQVALDGSGTKSDPYRPNEELRDKVYAKIPGLKFYRCENSTWDCPADFFYYGISDDSIKEFIEKTYSKKNNINESRLKNLPAKLYHATPSENTQSILKNGLVIGKQRRYGISRNVICLTNSKDAALDFLFDGAGSISKKNLDVDDVTLFEVQTKDLDASQLELDPNKKTPENSDPNKDIFYLEYHKDIPPNKLKISKNEIETFDFSFDDIGLSDVLDENDVYEQSLINKLIDDVVDAYANKFDIDLSYMKFKVDIQPVSNNGEPCYKYSPDECGGDWTKLGWIRLNPDMKSVMVKYGIQHSMTIDEFTKIIIAHELAHEVWNNIADDGFKEMILDEAKQQDFNTVYLKTVKPSKLDEETFCEYLAQQIVQPNKDISFPDEEIAKLSQQSHIVTHRVSDDANRFNAGDIVIAPWGTSYKVTNKTMVDKVEDSPYIDDLSPQQIAFLDGFDEIAVLELDAQYEPPYSLEQIKAKYPEHIYNKLANDPVHKWRAETGIELIHKEPSEEELDRIWKNWQLMPQEMKDKSEQKSLETFGMTNAEHYKQLKKHKDINKEQINEIQNDIYIEEVKIYQAKKLIDEVQDKHLYDVYPFEPNNIRMGASIDDRFFVGYVGQPCVENATAVIAVKPNYPYGGFFYVDQITGIKKGYGIKTLEALLTKNRSWRNKKIWWLASPMRRNKNYYENIKLNNAYRSIPGIKEYRKEDTLWGCPSSWFYTANCGNSIKKYIDDGNWI